MLKLAFAFCHPVLQSFRLLYKFCWILSLHWQGLLLSITKVRPAEKDPTTKIVIITAVTIALTPNVYLCAFLNAASEMDPERLVISFMIA